MDKAAERRGATAAGKVKTAKLFRNGRSQAVRLPKEFRFEGNEVRIRREGRRVVLEPMAVKVENDWGWLDRWREQYGSMLDDAFVAAVNEKGPAQERPELDALFKLDGMQRAGGC
jgi:antitoxin VapB